jgi:hypothetical protein
MMKKNILIAFLLGVAAFSAWQFSATYAQRQQLADDLSLAQATIANLKDSLLIALQKERALAREVGMKYESVRQAMIASERRIASLSASFERELAARQSFESEAGLARAERDALRAAQQEMAAKVDQLSRDNDAYRQKLSSIDELRKVIRELRVRAHRGPSYVREKVIIPVAATVTGAAGVQSVPRVSRSIEGNQGFIIKDGKPTVPGEISIDVVPISTTP